MKCVPAWADGLLRLALRAHPEGFRERYGAEMRAYFRDAWRAAPGGMARGWLLLGSIGSALVTGLWQRARRQREPRVSAATWRLDLRHAVRSLVRRPSLAAVIVVTLGIGVGANAAVFGTLYSVVLAPLPYPQSSELVRLYQRDLDGDAYLQGFLTVPSVTHYREHTRTLSALAASNTYHAEGADLTGHGRPERLRILRVSADYFSVLAGPARGRPFQRVEENADARVAVVSAELAQRLGPTAQLDGLSYDIVGSMPAGFEDPVVGRVDVWLPLPLHDGGYESWEWDNHYLTAIGRIAPGYTMADVRAEITHLSRLQGEIEPVAATLTGTVVDLQSDVVGDSDTLLAILMSAAGLLLLLTFVNVCVLLVARSLDRTHEVSVRTALGSPKSRLVRQYLFEGMVLAFAGSAAGAIVALPLQRVLVLLAPAGALDRAAVPSPWPILAFGLVAALIAGGLFGMAPALGMRRVDPTGALRQAGRGSDGRWAARMREGLVVAQVAMALVLLVGAGVLVESLERLRGIDMNVRTGHVLTFQANLPEARYADAAREIRFRADLARRLEALPGVRAAGAISHLPVTGRYLTWGARRAIGDNDAERAFFGADQRVVSGRAFEVLGIPVVAGRPFEAGDDENANPRVVINEALANDMFGGAREAIGQGIRLDRARREVIGVVADVPIDTRGTVAPMMYHVDRQFTRFWTRAMVQVVATEPGRTPALDRIADEVAALDPDLVVHQPRPLADVIGTGRAPERFAAHLLTTFAGLAVILSALGLYGILAHALRRRRREIGIRLALGARERAVMTMMLRRGLLTATAGLVIGVAGAAIATRGLAALVYGVGVRDPRVFAGSVATMLAVAVLASLLPAARATRVSPAETFRSE